MARNKPTVALTFAFHPEVIREKLAPRAGVVLARTPAALRTADAAICMLWDKIDARWLARAPKLRALGTYSVGTNHIDLDACARRGVRVANTPGVLSRATAECAAALLLAAARRVPEGHELCRTGRWTGWRPDQLLGLELLGRRAVLVGRGRIGEETARIFRGLGLKVEWITRRDSEKQLRAKLARAQVLSLHVPLEESTRHWLDRARLACLPPDAIVINTSRGPVIDERALTEALRKRRIFSAGLDVYEREPEIPSALRRLSNVVLLPHLGSATAETRRAMAEQVIQGVLDLLDDKRPPNEVKIGT